MVCQMLAIPVQKHGQGFGMLTIGYTAIAQVGQGPVHQGRDAVTDVVTDARFWQRRQTVVRPYPVGRNRQVRNRIDEGPVKIKGKSLNTHGKPSGKKTASCQHGPERTNGPVRSMRAARHPDGVFQRHGGFTGLIGRCPAPADYAELRLCG